MQRFGQHLRGHGRTRSRGGFTVLELLVVGVLGILVISLSTQASSWYVHAVHEINVAAQLNKQMKLAAEAIAQDSGAMLEMQTNSSGTDLEFDIDSGDGTAQWGSPDTVIHYEISGGDQLVRTDLGTGIRTTVARNVTGLTVTVDGAYLDVHIVVGYRTDQQNVNLQLRGS